LTLLTVIIGLITAIVNATSSEAPSSGTTQIVVNNTTNVTNENTLPAAPASPNVPDS
jgi:hypothetical protein